MEAFDKYSNLFVDYVRRLLDEGLAKDPEYEEVFKNRLLGLKGQRHVTRKNKPEEIFFSRLFNGFTEISDSYNSLLDIETYIGRFPYSNIRISKTRYLKYHMENYLNEMYILKERLITYFTTIGRLYRHDRNSQDILRKTRVLSSFVQRSLQGIVDTRSTHVHQIRFDDDLDTLKIQEFLSEHGGKELKPIKDLFKFEYRSVRKKYKQTLKGNRDQVENMLDACFDILYGIVADDAQQIKISRAVKNHQ